MKLRTARRRTNAQINMQQAPQYFFTHSHPSTPQKIDIKLCDNLEVGNFLLEGCWFQIGVFDWVVCIESQLKYQLDMHIFDNSNKRMTRVVVPWYHSYTGYILAKITVAVIS